MSVTIYGRTGFSYFEQVGSIFCGQACAEMMLSHLNVPITGVTPQMTLTGYKASNFSKMLNDVAPAISGKWKLWATNPDQMVNMLHGVDNSSTLWINFFDPKNHSSLDSTKDAFISALATKTKSDSGAPPPVLPIHDGSHWVVLYQYAEKNINGTLFRSFVGNDPIYYASEEKIGPSGGSSFSWMGKVNIAHKKINFKNAENLLMIEQTYLGNIASRRNLLISEPPIIVIPAPQPKKPIPAKEVRALTKSKLDAFGITGPCMAGRHLEDAEPNNPLLVRRMNKSSGDYSDDYYLIGMQTNLHNRLLVRIDATTGLYLDSLGIPPTPYLLGESSTPPQFFGQVLDTMQTDLRNAFEQQFKNNPKLVWKPCIPSQSAFYPFYEVVIPSTPSVKWYVRIDGKFFREAELTTLPNS